MQLYTMNRNGYFLPIIHTPNQCVKEGAVIYNYQCKIIFHPNQKLDQNQFLIDHLDINEIIINAKVKGSCETIAAELMNKLRGEFELRNIVIVGGKISVFPHPLAQANLSCIYVKDKSYLSLLN